MEDHMKFKTILEDKHIIVVLDVPELDLEHESNLELNVFSHECTFTAAPYHERIPLQRAAKPGKIYPEKIDYEKGTVTFHVPLDVATQNEGVQSSTFPYGFLNLYSGPLSLDTSQELKVLSNPEVHSHQDRWKIKESSEAKDFSKEHYGMDYIEFNIERLGLTLQTPPIANELDKEQIYRIKAIVEEKLRQKDTYTSMTNHGTVLLGLIDILLAIGYDRLTNNQELNEANSHLNIHRISATLSCFVEYNDVRAMVRSFYRRSCTYPYYRHKEISMACVEHVLSGVKSESVLVWIEQQLMHAYDAFKANDCAVLNHYFIKDYIRYVELGLNKELLQTFVKDMEKVLFEVHQETLGFGEEKFVQKLLKEVMTQEESDSTDSDDYDSSEDESGNTDNSSESVSSEEDINPNENVLEKLMNLKISP